MVLIAVPGGFPRAPLLVRARPGIAIAGLIQRALVGLLITPGVAPGRSRRPLLAVTLAADRRLLSAGPGEASDEGRSMNAPQGETNAPPDAGTPLDVDTPPDIDPPEEPETPRALRNAIGGSIPPWRRRGKGGARPVSGTSAQRHSLSTIAQPTSMRARDAMGDDARIWAALDSLIHPAAAESRHMTEVPGDGPAGTGPASAHQVLDATQRGMGSQRQVLPPGIVDALTGLYDPNVWSRVIASELARWTRFQRPLQVVQVEVSGIEALAARLGQAPAERLLVLLAVLLREESRACDLYGRSASWRIQGILLEQEPSGGARYADRIRTGFERRLGPGLPLGLIIGIATPGPDGDLAAAFLAADQAMHRDRRPSAVPAPGLPASELGGRAGLPDVHASLLALSRLREDGLISDDEFVAKRVELLGRL